MVEESETSVTPVGKKRLSRSRRQMYMQIVVATVILACGVVIGSGAALLRLKDDIVPPNRFPPPARIATDIQERYGLTDDQTEKVKTVVVASSERVHTIFTGFREKMDAEFKELSAAMKDILTPEEFKRWEKDFTSRRTRGPGRFGPGRGGPGSRPGSGGPGFGSGGRGGPGGGRSGSGKRGPGGPDGGRFDQRRRERPGPNSPPQ